MSNLPSIPARLEALHEDIHPQRVDLVKPSYTLGRLPERDIFVDDERVSRLHAIITCRGHEVFIEDNNSANGTFVNHVRLKPQARQQLQHRDIISFLLGDSPRVMFFIEDATVHVVPRLDWDAKNQSFVFCGRPVELSPDQLRLMSHLWEHRGQICHKQSCAKAIWPDKTSYDKYVDDAAIEKCIERIRLRFKQIDLSGERLITTQRGLGYRLYSIPQIG